MFKKLSASIFALALIAGAFAPALAQTETVGTIGLYFAELGQPPAGRFGATAPGGQFDVVVVTNIDQPSCAVEFVMTELLVEVPGILKLNTTKVNNTPLDLGDNDVGEYLMAYAGCIGGGPQEPVRVTYGTFTTDVPPDTILTLRGFQAGDTQPSTFGGRMGWIDGSDGKFFIDPEPWPDGQPGNIDPAKLPDGGAGACVLNADTVPTDSETMSSLKTRF
jgi:hypothetical protein